ncbi:MAG: Tetratricopeptide repeat protein [Sphingobacteriales bacterium]|nr:Tetratricopeptide repeat protein [Sphingobacteriales bacterium]
MTLKSNCNMLTRILFLFLVLMFPLISWGTEQQQALFEKANQLYSKAKYKEALKVYEQSVADGYQSAEVFFNMGNAYYRVGEIPSALLYYEKAHKLHPSDEDIDANIQLANSKTTDKIEAAPEFFLTTWWHKFFLLFSVDTLSALNIFCWITAAIVMVVYLFAQSITQKKVTFYMGIAFFFLGLITILITKKQSDYLNSHQEAIIFSTSVKVKSEPSDVSKDLFIIHAGVKVDIVENQENWLKIKLLNGNQGWISAESAREI